MGQDRVVLILGAGATLADGSRKPVKSQPPLDRGFFSGALRSHSRGLRDITRYMQEHYRMDLRRPANDSLERVMAALYTDAFGGDLERQAFAALRTLIGVFLKRLADTTNDIAMTPRSLLYRLVVSVLNAGVPPSNLTIVTFNQDIQVEKALDAIGSRRRRAGQTVLSFPGCYHLPPGLTVSRPFDPDAPEFRIEDTLGNGVALLKLHGSLNWYSRHKTPNPSKRTLFDPKRPIFLTSRKSIDPSMRVTVAKSRIRKFTFPIVIPPVVHKSGILHADLFPVWALAEDRMRTADRVVIFGYSCPANDWESANLISRSLTANRGLKEISLIDPDSGVVLRYVELGSLSKISYYKSAAAYLAAE